MLFVAFRFQGSQRFLTLRNFTQPLKKAKVYSFQLDISNVFDIVHCNSVPDCGSNQSERRNRYLFSNGYLKDWSLYMLFVPSRFVRTAG